MSIPLDRIKANIPEAIKIRMLLFVAPQYFCLMSLIEKYPVKDMDIDSNIRWFPYVWINL